MTAHLQAALDKATDQQDDALDRLFSLLKTQSISTDPAYHDHCVAAADILVADLTGIGFDAIRIDSTGKPFVFAEWLPHPDKPTVLFYGHYDVQPVDPISEWENDPFAPALEDTPAGKVIRARGAADDKGQLMTFVEACRAIIAANGELPINVKIIFEGEEESGSPSLPKFLEDHGDKLKADVALVCDTNMWNAETPAIISMLRGMASIEVVVEAADRDLHSGYYGGAARNPIQVLSNAIAKLRDDTGRITLDGFYDDVFEPTQDQLDQWNGLGMDADAFLKPVNLSKPAGEDGRAILEQIWSRPTCEINGIEGGYTGEGFKTVIPSKAMAKISCRLVPHQDPVKIHAALQNHFISLMPEDCTVSFTTFGEGGAITQDTTTPFMLAARTGLEAEWGVPAVVAGCGGSIPIVGDFQSHLGLDSLLIGFGLDNDRIHSPNEKYNLTSFQRGCRSWIQILYAIAV